MKAKVARVPRETGEKDLLTFAETVTGRVEFVGVVMRVNGKEIIKKVAEPVTVNRDDMLEIEIQEGLYVKLARERQICFGENSKSYSFDWLPRAERRREERIHKAHRLITLE